MFLCITVRFHEHKFHGRDGGELQFPPDPLRLFQAMVNAAARRFGKANEDFPAVAMPALKWLESLGKPTIFAPKHTEGRPLTLSCPDNVEKRLDDPSKHRILKTIKYYNLNDDIIHYLWDIAAIESNTFDMLRDILHSLTSLGCGVDMAYANLSVVSDLGKISGEKWISTTKGSNKLRVPRKGTLENLIDKHKSTLNSSNGKCPRSILELTEFDLVRYGLPTEASKKDMIVFELLNPNGGGYASFPDIAANRVAAMTRHALNEVVKQQGRHDLIEYINCHNPKKGEIAFRASFLPLISLPKDGLKCINRIAISELHNNNGYPSHLLQIQQMLEGQFLIDEKTGPVAKVFLSNGDNVTKKYTKASRTWATVTPVVLNCKNAAKRKKSFLGILEQAGYNQDMVEEEPIFDWVSHFGGIDKAKNFAIPNYFSGKFLICHMQIKFKEAVHGPIAIGHGRHCGLGIFAPCERRGD